MSSLTSETRKTLPQGFRRVRSSCSLLINNIFKHHRFLQNVDRGDLVIGADEWPTFLYDETQYHVNREWQGLFLGETFVRVSSRCLLFVQLLTTCQGCICILIGPSAAQEWPYGTPSSRSYAASQKKGNADLNNIMDITAEVVAGLVCQVGPIPLL